MYQTSFNHEKGGDVFSRTNAEFTRTNNSAGNFNPNRQESVRNLSNLIGELKKEQGDEK